MHGNCCIFLLTYMVAVAIPAYLAFNIATTNPVVYEGRKEDFFGYKVLQFMSSTNKGIIVTAPLKLNGSGGICKAGQSTCFYPEDISVQDTTIPVKHLGLSIAQESKHSKFTVCSPSLVHECNENSYLNSVCYSMTDNLEELSSLRPAFQDCTKKTVDLVFLFDGSLSMTKEEFHQNKIFIMDIMRSLDNTSIKFAAVQFSMESRKVFDFNDYEKGSAITKLLREPHMSSLTNTHSALQFVLKEIFENPEAGASSDSTKVLVLITDGDPSDEDDHKIVQKYAEKKIIRFVIGNNPMCCTSEMNNGKHSLLYRYFSGKNCGFDKVKVKSMKKFEDIVSEPKDQYAFKIENYNGLKGILENFQNRIFNMEGSDVARAGDMTNEMSQSGFSAVLHKDTLILGSVGSNVWRGSLQEYRGQKHTQIEDPQMKNDSYLGYSTSVGEKKNTILYFTGAPRFEHKGLVVLFKHDGKSWVASQRITGEQIGSYFGAELCSVDVDSDGNTDFLLVGAPQFYQPQEKREGQIYVYTLTDEMQLKSILNVNVPSTGRFGTTISSLADLNGDELRDVAVGAPLEDDSGGAVYIFLGDRRRGIRSTFSQRITGEKVSSGLRFFGQAIDGDIDLGEDRLPDIVVGSQGTVVVLSSRPVFDVKARLSFEPKEISTENIDCLASTDENLPMVTLTACFEMVEKTKSKAGAVNSGLNISFMLDVDPMRQTYRGFFSNTDKKARNLASTYELRDNGTCLNYHIYMPKCVRDTLTPIGIKLNFAQVEIESASAVLNVDSKRQASVEIPFEKQCRKNDTCIAELEVDFDFMTQTLLVAEDNYFNVSITLANHGDDSYNTSISMHYPTGLSFSRMNVTKATRPTLHSCHDLDGVLDKTICGVSLPVYRSGSSATFLTSFHIMDEYEWNDTLSMTIIGQSDNSNSTWTTSLTKTIPVQFEIKIALAVHEDSDTYLNFTTENAEPKQMVVKYKIDNPGLRAFPINVSLVFPTTLAHDFEMEKFSVFVPQNKTQCTSITDTTSKYCSQEKRCKIITCDSFILDQESATEFILTGDVQFKDLQQQAANVPFLKKYTGDGSEVKFKSFIRVSYDEQRYVLDSKGKIDESGYWKDPTMKWTEVRVEFIIFPNHLQIIATGVVFGLLLLIIVTIIMFKLGCFKRKTAQYYEEQEEEAARRAGSSIKSTGGPTNGTVSPSETDSKSDQPLEEKALLEKSEANSINLPAEKREQELD